MSIEITEAAAKRVKDLIEKSEKNSIALRVSVDGGGCSGFMYQYELVEKINSDDFLVENYGVKVAIDPVSIKFLNDCTIEFVQELGASFFQIINPNASAKCGCGNSFAI
jgi:iron-sulfur cluster insertion protein